MCDFVCPTSRNYFNYLLLRANEFWFFQVHIIARDNSKMCNYIYNYLKICSKVQFFFLLSWEYSLKTIAVLDFFNEEFKGLQFYRLLEIWIFSGTHYKKR